MKRPTLRFISILLTVAMLIGLLPMALPASANAATAVTITATDGSQTVLAADTTTATYTYDADTATLTLNNFAGRRIFANGAMNLHLKGTNTLTLADIEGETGYGIRSQDNGFIGELTISAEDGATLNINGTGLTRTTMGLYAAPIIKNGTININMSGTGLLYGVYGSVEFAKEQTKPANLNVRVENTGSSAVIGISNGGLEIGDCANEITINVEAYNTTSKATACDSSLWINNSAPKITFKASAPATDAYKSAAFNGNIYEMGLNEGGKITFDGMVSCYDPKYKTNTHTAFTTPADNAYFWQKDRSINPYSNYYFLKDATGAALNKAVLEYTDASTALTWRGEGFFSIPETKVGVALYSLYFKNYITGASGFKDDSEFLYFEIIEGALPEGLSLNSIYGYFDGTPTTPCPAGTVTMKCTDRNGTYSDTSDDRSITFTIPYGAVAEADLYLTVNDGTPLEMKEDGSGEGWSYDGETATLTLNGYNGKKIYAEKPFNLHLEGTNTITMADIEGEYGYGIRVDDNDAIGDLTISAEDGAILNISGTALTKTAMGLYAAPLIKNGTININMSGTGNLYGVYGSVEFAKEQTKPANLNVRVENTHGGSAIVGIDNGALEIEDCANEINVNIEAYNTSSTATACGSSLWISNSAPKITFKASAPEGEAYKSAAFNGTIYELGLNEGGKITFDGMVSCYDPKYKTNTHTAFTTPADNAYFWQQDKTINPYSNYYFLKDGSGAALNKAVLEYVEEETALAWRGEGFFSIPETKVGTSLYSLYFKNYITGASGYKDDSEFLYFEIIEGALPEGLSLNSIYGYFDGTPTTPCPAGTVTMRCTDRNGTYSDTSDDRSITFTIPYGAIKSDKPVTALTLSKEELILNKGDSASITVTPTPADASYPNISATPSSYSNLTVEAGEPVGGVTTVTVTAGTWAGAYSVAIKALDTGLNKTLNVYVKEKKPTITYDAENSMLCGFYSGASYRISAEGVADYEFDSNNNTLPMQAEWLDKTLTIICLNDENAKCNSDPCILGVSAYTLTVTKGSGSGNYPAGSICRIEADAPAEGYRFTGWSGTEDLAFRNETDKDDAIIYIEMPEKDLAIEATYQLITYELAFSNLYGGSGEMAPLTGGNTYTLPDCTFTPPAGKEFSHWIVGGQQKQPGDSVTLTADTIAYASWKADTTTLFDIKINGGAATIGDAPATEAAQFTRVYIKADEPAAGSVFEKWVVNAGNVIISNPNAEETYFDMLYEDVEITATYHTHIGNLTFHQEEPSTCKEQGKKAYYECSCGNFYEDENAATRIYNLAAWGNLPLDEHTIESGTLGPHECSVCHEPINPFTDINSGAYYFDSVLWAIENNITSGTSATTFAPTNTCTRGQVVTFLWNAAGKPEPTIENPFTDVKPTDWYYKAVLWAVENHITSGTSATTFSPKNPCTRAQVVTFLWNSAGKPEPTIANPFTDVNTNGYYYKAMLWAVENGITSGTSATTFAPTNPCTRAQIVSFLYRYEVD